MSTSLVPPKSDPANLTDREAREVICDLCRQFYNWGWATGTGGGISVRSGHTIYMAPSGVQKERLRPDDIFKLDLNGNVTETPRGDATVSACRPLFMHAYQLRNAGAVLHSHSLNAAMATLISGKSFQISNIEMQKGIEGTGVFDTLEVPIIENTAHESELADALKEAILAYPKSHAVLVRGHGVYVWGKTWVQAKTQAECYDYLFAAAVKLKSLRLDPQNKRR